MITGGGRVVTMSLFEDFRCTVVSMQCLVRSLFLSVWVLSYQWSNPFPTDKRVRGRDKITWFVPCIHERFMAGAHESYVFSKMSFVTIGKASCSRVILVIRDLLTCHEWPQSFKSQWWGAKRLAMTRPKFMLTADVVRQTGLHCWR